MRGKKRPPLERGRAVALSLVHGVEAASEETGVPERTILDWRNSPEFAELRSRTREAASDELWAIVQKGFRRVEELIPDSDEIQKVAIATAIVADKMLLLRGEATDRYETKDLTSGLNDHEREVLGDAIRNELARRADERASVDAVGVPAEA